MSVHSNLLTPLRRFYADRRGAFAISFVLLSGALLSLAALGIEGPRYITERARLSDAMEQAALALTAEDNGEGAARNYTLASDYFRAYMRHDVAVFTPNISVRHGNSSSNINLNYVEYRVNGQTLQDSWFSSSLFPSFDKQVVIGDNGAARKYRSNIDVVFVTDFSESMNWGFGSGSKLSELKRIVLKLSSELYSYGINNRVGFVPFGWGGEEDGWCDFRMITTAPVPNDILIGASGGGAAKLEKYIDYYSTVGALPNRVSDVSIPISDVDPGYCLRDTFNWTVPLTSNISQVRQIESMTAGGATLVSNGILMGVPVLAAGTARRKIMIIVSDGTDDPDVGITQKLMAAGMCDKIRSVISTKESVGKMAFVGIAYSPTYDWKRCVGEKNFYTPKNVSQLEFDLRRAIFEEVGHNIIKD